MGRGTTRRVVEGLNGAGVQYVLNYALGVAMKFGSHNPQHTVALCRQPRVTPLIPFRIVAHLMRVSIDLDDELLCSTIEIENERPGRVLMPKFETGRASS